MAVGAKGIMEITVLIIPVVAVLIQEITLLLIAQKLLKVLKVLDLKDTSNNVIVSANDNSTVKFSIQVLNKDSGGITNKDVTLSITDSDKLGVTSKVFISENS